MADLVARARRRPPTRSRHAAGGLILPLAISVFLVVAAGAFVAFVLWPRWPGATTSAEAPSLPITIEGTVFNVPPAAIRRPLQRRAGAQERIDLAFVWPSLAPPDPAAKPAPSSEPPPLDRIFVSIAGSQGALAPVARLKEIYPRYFADGQFAGPDGLVVMRFRDGTPYQGEDLFFDAESPAHFLARCSGPGSGAVPGTCLLERRIENVDVTTRFPRDWLADWRMVASGIDRMIAGLRPASK